MTTLTDAVVRLSQLRETALVLAGLLALSAVPRASASEPGGVPVLVPYGVPWSAGVGFDFERRRDKTRRSASGIACPPRAASEASRTCLVVFDEGAEARFAQVGNGSLAPRAERVPLRPPGVGELYVTGSHAAKRGDCSSNPDGRHVIRFRRDDASGGAARDPTGALDGYADSDRLWQLMATQPELAPFVGEGKCLGTLPPPGAPALRGRRGVDVEGLAAKGGRLFFGFRGPVVEGRAPVLGVQAAGLFDTAGPDARVTFLDLGEGRGIRDLQSVSSGFLVLAGPGDDPTDSAVGYVLAFWDGESKASPVARPRVLARLDLREVRLGTCDKEIKPEGVAVLDETPSEYLILVLSDGMCDGGPTTIRIPR
jgi:hypothetical protein